MRIALIAEISSLVFSFLTSLAYAQDQPLGPPDAATMQRLRLRELAPPPPPGAAPGAALAPPASWTLNTAYRAGTYGIDLSRYETDGCTVNWSALPGFGLRYIYLETSTGVTARQSVTTAWKQLASMHTGKTLFRGAYHFLYPNFLVVNNTTPQDTDASAQATTFLQSIGVTPGVTVPQLPPVIDMEPTKTPVDPSSADWTQCPQDSRETDGSDHYCDMWHKMSSQDIVTFTQNWIGTVEKATSQHVIIYTNANWWQSKFGSNGNALLQNRAIWISRYPQSGAPDYVSSWTAQGGNPTLRMPPLPNAISYPNPYNIADFWQFAATGSLSSSPFTCPKPSDNPMTKLDLNYIPVSGAQFLSVFGLQ